MSNFCTIDVETANADLSSICQIGIAEFHNGQVISTWECYLNPNTFFDDFNVDIHGVTREMVQNSPQFPKVYDEIKKRIQGKPVLHHTHFDRLALNQVCEKYRMEPFEADWLDSAKIVRRTWKSFSKKGYGLENVAKKLDIDYLAHDALEDAIATGKVVLKAIEKTGVPLEDWRYKVNRRITPPKSYSKEFSKLEVNTYGVLYGETLVFTGTLFITRNEAAAIAAELGCVVKDNVTRETTILVFGDQDEYKLAGHKKSSKHRKAEKLIESGFDIKILTEDDFKSMAENIIDRMY